MELDAERYHQSKTSVRAGLTENCGEMKRRRGIRDAKGRPEDSNVAKEVMAVMFVMVEKIPGAFTLRLVQNDEVINALRSQGAIQTFLDDADQLFAGWRSQFEGLQNPSPTH
jgi:hypothetical protein